VVTQENKGNCSSQKNLLRLRVVPLSLSPSCVTQKKTARKKWWISLGHFFLAVFFRVTHDGLSERGSTLSLESTVKKHHSALTFHDQSELKRSRIKIRCGSLSPLDLTCENDNIRHVGFS